MAAGEAGWVAETNLFDVRPPAGTRGGASLNVSIDGVPKSALRPTRDGFVGYCSQSGWGCIEIAAPESGVETAGGAARGGGYEGDWNQSWTKDFTMVGMDVQATAQGGVKVHASYELSYSWLAIPNGIEWAKIETEPYAQGSISATIDTAGGSSPDYSEPVLQPVSVVIYSAALLTLSAEFGIDAVAELVSPNNQPVDGSWTGSTYFSRTYAIGYESRRAQSGGSGFYGPEYVRQDFNVAIVPAFGDGSSARAWFGWKATGAVVLKVTPVGELARAELAATTGLVFSHDSSLAAPCGQTVSITHADIGLGARLDGTLDLAFFDPWQVPLAEEIYPILTWGRERTIATAPRISPDSQFIDFRLPNRSFGDHDHPGTSSHGIAIADDMDVKTDPSALQAFLDGQEITSSGLELSDFRYRASVPANTLQSGTDTTFAVWMPDNPPATPTADKLLRAPGQCIETALTVDTR